MPGPDARSPRERYAGACQSSDLSPGRADLSALVAAGWAGRQHRLGVAWIRLREGLDAREYRAAMAGLQQAALRLVRDRRLKVATSGPPRSPTPDEVAVIAQAVAHWHLNDTCPRCLGRKQLAVADTPCLGQICPTCHGTGRTPLERRVASLLGRVWVPLAQTVFDALAGSTGAAAGRIRRGMR